MSWLQVQIDLGNIDPVPLEHALLRLGAVCIEFSDAGNKPILEPDPGTPRFGRRSGLRRYLASAPAKLQFDLPSQDQSLLLERHVFVFR